MTDAPGLRAFLQEFFADAGGTTSEDGDLLWVDAPPRLAHDLGLGPRFPLTFDPSVAGRFGAELVAPGSYVLDRVLAVAMRRGRWGASVFRPRPEDWLPSGLPDAGLRGLDPGELARAELRDERLLVFAFRVTLTADEKRESFHAIAVPDDGTPGWSFDPTCLAVPAEDAGIPASPPDLVSAYRIAMETLRASTSRDVEAFRGVALSLLDEEVRRVLRYYDRTVEEMREAQPPGLVDLVRAIEAERDRRLMEALERFDPKAAASLASVRLVTVPCARICLSPSRAGAPALEIRVDAWTRRARGARCQTCGDTEGPWTWDPANSLRCDPCLTGAESARPRARPMSDTPRR